MAQAYTAHTRYTLMDTQCHLDAEPASSHKNTIFADCMHTQAELDPITHRHATHTIELATRLARAMGVAENALADYRQGAYLHDIGKLFIPRAILQKPGPLTAKERETIEQHPQQGYRFLQRFSLSQTIMHIVLFHHERWDGSGYPYRLREQAIPLEARIFAVADVWSALTQDRPYRAAWSFEAAYQHICNHTAIHFDPEVVAAFARLTDSQPVSSNWHESAA